MIRVMVVDDGAPVRPGLRSIPGASGDIEVVAAVNGSGAMTALAAHEPDVVLLDVPMPDADGLTVLRRIRDLPSPPAVALLTTADSGEYIPAALRAGAVGFILKDTDPAQLAEFVRTLAAGGSVLSPAATRVVIGGYLHQAGDTVAVQRVRRLTERERGILVLVAEGLSNSDIAVRMHLSVSTVKGHVSAILTKLRVGTRVQAALLAQSAGMLRQRQA